MAKVLTGISGNLISAASAGFAPTNKADVSSIASAYQVVSATATQLYAGTAYVTSVNGAPLSASRAGNAANASLASSAWYDGTGRLISSLPDSAAVSAIASAYAESAASGKQDELTFSYDDDKISAINGSALAGQGGGELVTSIQSAVDPWYGTSISGINGSSLYSRWAEAANSARQASVANQAISANYAASAPTAWASSFITGVASPSGTIRVLDGTAIEGTNSAMLPSTVIPGFESASSINAESWSPGTSIGPGVDVTGTIPSENPYTNLVLKMGWGELTVSITGNNGKTTSVSKVNSDEYVTAKLPNATSYTLTTDGWVTLYAITASAVTQEVGGGVGELAWASALPTYSYDAEDKISAINGSAIAGGAGGATGDYVEKSATSVAIGTSNTAGEYSLAIGSGNYVDRSKSLVIGTDNSADLDNIAVGDANSADMDSIAVGYNNASYMGAAIGQMNTGERNSLALGMYSYASDNSIAVGNRASAEGNPYSLGGSIAVGMDVSAGDGSYAVGGSSTATDVSFAHGHSLSAIHSAAVFGTYNLSGNGSDSSGAAFVIGDGTASNARHDLMVVTKDGEITMYSGTADTVGTGIMSSIRALSANAGGVDSATVSAIASSYAESAVSGKADSSALSSYALSADVSGTVDLVSTQSANWGGSALALSAGPGVKLEKVGNTLVASTDETVLWSGSSNTGSLNLLESKNNFQKLNFHLSDVTGYNSVYTMDASASYATFSNAMPYPDVTNALILKYISVSAASDTSFTSVMHGRTILSANHVEVATNSDNSLYCTKIVGINRTAEA